MKKKEKYANFRGLKKMIVYEVHVNEGEGDIDDPIYREVYYVTEDGQIIGKKTKSPARKFAGEID